MLTHQGGVQLVSVTMTDIIVSSITILVLVLIIWQVCRLLFGRHKVTTTNNASTNDTVLDPKPLGPALTHDDDKDEHTESTNKTTIKIQ